MISSSHSTENRIVGQSKVDLAPTRRLDLSYRFSFLEKKTEESVGSEICGVLIYLSKARAVTLTTKHVLLMHMRVYIKKKKKTVLHNGSGIFFDFLNHGSI